MYCEQWDAYFESTKGEWLEPSCGSTVEEDCHYRCWERPKNHSKHKWEFPGGDWGICGVEKLFDNPELERLHQKMKKTLKKAGLLRSKK